MTEASSKRPYLIRAMHEWMTDNDLTPHLVVSADGDDVIVPEHYVSDGKIILNVSYAATQALQLGNDKVSFEARFEGTACHVEVPTSAVLGIYARETGQGMIFTEDEPPDGSGTPADDKPSGPPNLKVIK